MRGARHAAPERCTVRGRGAALLGLLAAFSTGVTLPACRRDATESASGVAGSAARAPQPALPQPRRHPPLPEDAELGRQATAQWQEHEEEEERNRRRCYDHERLAQHRAVVASLDGLRQRYERAKSQTELARARLAAQHDAAALRARIDAIDPWQNSSLLVADYDTLLAALEGRTADAPSAGASQEPPGRLRAELNRQRKTIQQKLAEADECEQD